MMILQKTSSTQRPALALIVHSHHCHSTASGSKCGSAQLLMWNGTCPLCLQAHGHVRGAVISIAGRQLTAHGQVAPAESHKTNNRLSKKAGLASNAAIETACGENIAIGVIVAAMTGSAADVAIRTMLIGGSATAKTRHADSHGLTRFTNLCGLLP